MHKKTQQAGRQAGRRTIGIFAAAAFVATFAVADAAEEPAPPAALVELFTSQGCYSCPPAERILEEEIAAHPGAIALELHVDYWDDLFYGGGVWKDPFSDSAHTRRQTAYNIRIRDTRSVYTPQAVVQGIKQASGTQSERILRAVDEALATAPPVRFHFADSNTARVEGALPPGAHVHYAIFWRKRTTDITAGENKGKVLQNTNVVTHLERMPFGVREIRIPDYDAAEQGCAVWLQQGGAGRILAAARCPSS